MKYKEILNRWMNEKQIYALKHRTFLRYEEIIRTQIEPCIGEYELSNLSVPVLREFQSDKLSCGNSKNGHPLASNTVKNIIKLAEKGYYDGKVFYGKDDISLYVGRNSEGNIDYPKLSTLEETVAEEDDYEYEIEGEFAANNFNTNTLKHEKGTVSLIRADYTQLSADLLKESFNSGSSQFTILTQDERSLNGLYAAFGKVVEGMEIVEQISNIQVAQTDEENTQGISIKTFSTFPVIKKATVETFGYNYGFPKVNKAFDYDGYIQDLLTQYYKTTEE